MERDVEELLDAFAEYSRARIKLLDKLGGGNRDPLADFSEHLVASLMHGTLARSRVQKDWDVRASDQLVQVKYLSNSATGSWVNEITIRSVLGVDRFALVVYQALVPAAVLVFPNDLTEVCSALGKRHPDQSSSLQFTRLNYSSIMERPERFQRLGMQVIDLARPTAPFVAEPPGETP